MLDYIKSKALKEYHKKLNFVLSDEEIATLIYVSGNNKFDVFNSLKELAATTKDEELKKRIAARIASDEEDYADFRRREDNMIFLLDEQQTDAYPIFRGKYFSFKEACEAGKKLGKRFAITKVKAGMEEELDYNDLGSDIVMGAVSYDEKLHITSFYLDNGKYINTMEYLLNSFEEKPFWMPHPFRTGDKVRFWWCNEELTGVVAQQDDDKWDEALTQSVKEGFSDIMETLELCIVFPGKELWEDLYVPVTKLEFAE